MNTLNTYPVAAIQSAEVAGQTEGWRARVGRRVGQVMMGAMAGLSALVGIEAAAGPEPAAAAAYTRSVESPRATDGGVRGTATVNTDCQDTLGCWTHIKVEVKPEPRPGTPPWLAGGWQYAGGRWASNGRNELTVPMRSGCAEYRTVVDTYNDLPAEQGSIGISLGYKGVGEAGITKTINGVERYHVVARSATQRICMMA